MELTVDGQRAYIYTGTQAVDPTRPSVVFVHGAALDHTVWILQSRYFAYHGCNSLAVDLPGHGRSEGTPPADIQAMADWLLRLLDAAGLERAAIVGHSMGSLAALEAAARYCERVSRIALLGCASPMAVSEALLNAAQANDHAAIDMITVWGHSIAAHFGGNPAPGLWMVGGSLRLLEQAAPGVLYNDLKACNDYRHGLEAAARVRCPALLVLGKRDMMTPPRAARSLSAALAHVQTVFLDGCGHMMFYERPNETLDALIDFLLA